MRCVICNNMLSKLEAVKKDDKGTYIDTCSPCLGRIEIDLTEDLNYIYDLEKWD